MEWSLAAQFWLIAVLLALTPGADWAYSIAAGLRRGSIAPSILGLLAGYAALAAVVAFGVGALITAHPALLTGLTLAGAGYLIYLGVSTLVSKVGELTAAPGSSGSGHALQFIKGAGVSSFNPKGLLLLLALLPQFITPGASWPTSLQMLALGGLHIANCAIVYFAVAHGARRLLGSRPRANLIVSRVAGVVMLGFGALVLGELAVELLGAVQGSAV